MGLTNNANTGVFVRGPTMAKQKRAYPLPAHECVATAVLASVSPRTVHDAVTRRLPGTASVRARIRAALEQRGLAHLLPTEAL